MPFQLTKCPVPLVLACTLLGACAGPRTSETELSATWRGATHYVPGPQAGTARLVYRGSASGWAEAVARDGLIPVRKLPAVVHLHGCEGFRGADARWGGFYARQGFAFFGPDSFARSGRRVLCNEGQMRYRMAMRLEEAQYALEQIRRIPWIDRQRIVLSGFSEGGNAASSYTGTDFTGIVLLGVDCRHVGGSARAPRAVPVINIVGTADSYGYGGGCTRHGGALSRKLVIAGAPHDVSGEEDAGRALAAFLSAISR